MYMNSNETGTEGEGYCIIHLSIHHPSILQLLFFMPPRIDLSKNFAGLLIDLIIRCILSITKFQAAVAQLIICCLKALTNKVLEPLHVSSKTLFKI